MRPAPVSHLFRRAGAAFGRWGRPGGADGSSPGAKATGGRKIGGLSWRTKSRTVFAATILLVFASSAETYRFFGKYLDRTLTPSGASRWERADFPVRFRVLENGNLPDFEGLTPERWRDIIARAFRLWNEVPTARASLVLDEAPLPSEQADANDGFNTVGFSSYEGFVDAWFIGLAFWRQEGDRLVGCDIELNPAMFEVLDQRAVDNPEKDMERLAWLEMVVVHEAGHCLGLAHTDLNPIWEAWPEGPPGREGFFPEGSLALSPEPVMSYGGWRDFVGLTPDDAVGVSLLYPTPEFRESRGGVGGRIRFEDGRGVSFAYVQVVEGAGPGSRFGPGVFTDAFGHFLLEGLRPGTHLFWVHPVGALRAHFGPGQFDDADLLEVLDIRDRWFWAEVQAGELVIVPEVTISTGRTAP